MNGVLFPSGGSYNMFARVPGVQWYTLDQCTANLYGVTCASNSFAKSRK